MLAFVLVACNPDVSGLETTIAALNTTVADQAEEISSLEAAASQPSPSPLPSPTRAAPRLPTVALPSPEPVLTAQRPPTATPSPSPTATATATPTATPMPDASVGETLTNLRSGPGVGFEVLAEVGGGTPLVVLGISVDGEWLKVRTPEDQEGWMFYLPVELNVSLASIPIVNE